MLAEEEKSKVHFSIFGSCVSRDIFSYHDDDGGYIIDRYIGMINPLSMNSVPISFADTALLEQKVYDLNAKGFIKRNIYLDFTKKYWDYLSEKKSDYLLLDMSDIRLSVLCDRSGCLVSCREPNVKLMDHLGRENIYSSISKRNVHSFSHSEIREAVQYFSEKISGMYSQDKIIILECDPASEYYDKKYNIVTFPYTWNVEYCKKIIRYADSVLKENLPGAHIIPHLNNVIADIQHKWGKHVLHFEREYYDYALSAVNIITSKTENETTKIAELKAKYEVELLRKRVALLSRNTVRFADHFKVDSLYAPYINNIRSNTNLDLLFSPGAYRCASGKIKNTVQNLPPTFVENVGFRLTVKQIAVHTKEKAPLIQILEPNLPAAPVYRRHYSAVKNRWNPWLRLVTDTDLTKMQEEIADLKARLESQEETIRMISDKLKDK